MDIYIPNHLRFYRWNADRGNFLNMRYYVGNCVEYVTLECLLRTLASNNRSVEYTVS